jgi:hypothetical protein
MNWINLVQAKDQWMAFMNTVVIFGFHKSASQEERSSMGLV